MLASYHQTCHCLLTGIINSNRYNTDALLIVAEMILEQMWKNSSRLSGLYNPMTLALKMIELKVSVVFLYEVTLRYFFSRFKFDSTLGWPFGSVCTEMAVCPKPCF